MKHESTTAQKTLRPYQDKAVSHSIDRLEAAVKSLLLVAPPGAGKTVILSHLVEYLAAQGKHLLTMAHRCEIIEQISRTLAAAGIAHSVMMAGDKRYRADAAIQLTTVQTAARRRHRLRPADVVIIDEAHRTPASSYMELLSDVYPHAQLIGLTGTPWRLDGKALSDAYAEHFTVVSTKELVEQGYLVEPVIFGPSARLDLSGLRVTAGDYRPDDLNTLMNQAALCGDIVEHWFKHANGLPTIAFAVNQDHSRRIVGQFKGAGVPAAHVDCATPKDERAKILNYLRGGHLKVVSNVDILTEGFDVPELGCVILARPTKSLVRYLQSVGRVMRCAPGKTSAICLDHAGSVHDHGFPSNPRGVSLEGDVHPCPACKALMRGDAPACPKCGCVVQAERVEVSGRTAGERNTSNDDRELEQISKDHRRQCPACSGYKVKEFRHAKLGAFTIGIECHELACWKKSYVPDKDAIAAANDDGKLDEYERLVKVQMERGWSPKWPRKAFKETFGRYPETAAHKKKETA